MPNLDLNDEAEKKLVDGIFSSAIDILSGEWVGGWVGGWVGVGAAGWVEVLHMVLPGRWQLVTPL